MNKQIKFLSLITIGLFSVISFYSCKHEKPAPEPAPEYGNFPEAVGKIFINKCANTCHNSASYQNSANLLLETWEDLFKGGVNGAAVVPYSPENSPLLYFINTDSSLGNIVLPTMPYNAPPLSREEYLTIRDWIANGAPDKNGNIPFADNAATRQKLYLTQQGCDLLAVIDPGTKMVSRYIKLGMESRVETPHFVKVSPDGQYAYIAFTAGQYVQRINTTTDKVDGQVYIGDGSWNVLNISPDSKRLLVSNMQGSGSLVLIDAVNMTVINKFGPTSLLVNPHGITSNAAFDTFYVTSQYGNVVYKLTMDAIVFESISIDGQPKVTTAGKRDPHEIIMAPDYSKYFLSCEASHEVRVMDTYADTVIAAIPVGMVPKEFAISKTKPYLFVSCMEDNSTLAGYKGSVYVINYNTLQIVKRIDAPFYQPHGITLDEKEGVLYVASRNTNPDGPAPHHTSDCGGRNGYYQMFDLNTLQKLPGKYEVTADPYSFDVRFK